MQHPQTFRFPKQIFWNLPCDDLLVAPAFAKPRAHSLCWSSLDDSLPCSPVQLRSDDGGLGFLLDARLLPNQHDGRRRWELRLRRLPALWTAAAGALPAQG
eukprot:3452312-Pleurochrysis_carterae.AAC.1